MTRIAALAPLLFALCACATAVTLPAPTITKIESRELPSTVATHRILDQISDFLIYTPGVSDPRRPPTRALTDGNFYTRTRATDYPGLCTSDIIQIEFRPAGPDRGADTPVRASSIDVGHTFRYLAPPTLEPRGNADMAAGEPACAAIDPRDDAPFFQADSAEAAANGVWLLQMLRESVQANTLAVPIDCPNGVDCRARLADFTLEHIGSVNGCNAADRSYFCYQLDVGMNVLIEARHFSATNQHLHWEITKVVMRDYIILVHDRID